MTQTAPVSNHTLFDAFGGAQERRKSESVTEARSISGKPRHRFRTIRNRSAFEIEIFEIEVFQSRADFLTREKI